MAFRKAERKQAKLRLGIVGTSGSGKTYSSLLIAKGLGKKIALIDTENKSGDLYAGMAGMPEYDICSVSAPYTVQKYLDAIKDAENGGYDVVIIDSLTHAWAGDGGLLDQQGKLADSGRNSFTAWRSVTPQHNRLIDAMLTSPCHIIATMRAKTDYVLETNDKGKQMPKKVGLAPVQREGMDYEFTVVFDIDINHNVLASKDRTSMFDGQIFKPSPETGKALKAWLETGVEAEAPKSKAAPKEQQEPTKNRLINEAFELICGDKGLGLKKEELMPYIQTALNKPDIKSSADLTENELSRVIDVALQDMVKRDGA